MTGSWVDEPPYLVATRYGPDLRVHPGPLSRMWRLWAKSQPMLPIIYHQIPNVFWLMTSSIAMLYFLKTRRIMPRRPTLSFLSSPVLAKVMYLHHITHTLFYIIELCVTDMYRLYTPMFFHHLAAASLMILCIFEPGIFCAVYVMPFWVHGIFWVRGATEFDLLTIYNYCLLLAGIAGTYDAARLRVVTPVIPIICLALSSVNIFTYCWSYQGYYCPAPILPFERRKHRRRDSDLDLDFINSSSLTEIISHRRTKSSRLSNVYDYAKSWAMTKWRQSVRFLRHNSVHGSEASRNANGHVGDAVVNMPTTWKATVSPDDTGRNGFFVNNDSRKYL
ncbi:hypothetical protein SeLEV6574_g07124 [Synchytrium endobioticum]|uniref:TLC domain-containing protein n=1 Tax=Synchytrium endobioticum TaxID=286115 RepID=A0A507CM37_9FUNG|nr:hypothetical protein SeLEV6574_g07124 [Synchytrium endobioticum]